MIVLNSKNPTLLAVLAEPISSGRVDYTLKYKDSPIDCKSCPTENSLYGIVTDATVPLVTKQNEGILEVQGLTIRNNDSISHTISLSIETTDNTLSPPEAVMTVAYSAPVPYTTSRNNTATLVAANINANSLVSGCRAYVIPSPTTAGNFDTPIICIEAIETATSFVHTMIVTLTTLTIGSQQNPTLGFTPIPLILNSFYDVTNDRILYAQDPTRNVVMTTTVTRINSQTYNSICNFRWGDVRLNNIQFYNLAYRNVQYRMNASQTVSNYVHNLGVLDGVIFTNGNIINVYMKSSSIININSISFSFSGCNCTLQFTTLEAGTINIQNQESGVLTINNSTYGTSGGALATLTLGQGTASVTITAHIHNSTAAVNLSTNIGISTFLLTLNTITTNAGVNITNNRLYANITLTTGSTFSSTVGIYNNTLEGNLLIQNCAITGGLLISRNLIRTTGSQGIRFLNSSFSSGLGITDSNIVIDLPTLSVVSLFLITSSTIDSSCGFGKLNGSLEIASSVLGAEVLLGTQVPAAVTNILIQFSQLDICSLQSSEDIQIINTKASNVLVNGSISQVYLVSFNKCSIFNSTFVPNTIFIAGGGASDLVFIETEISNCIFDMREPACVTYTKNVFKNSTISFGSYGGFGILNCFINNSIINNGYIQLNTVTGGAMEVDGLIMENGTIKDYISPGLLLTESCDIYNVTIKNTNIQLLATDNVIKFSKFENQIQNIDILSNTWPIQGTEIIGGSYKITHVVDFAVTPLVVNTSLKISQVLAGFAFGVITYSSDTNLAPGTSKIGIGFDTAYNEFINDILCSVINAASATRTAGPTNKLVADAFLGLEATVGDLSAGRISFIIEGNYLQN